MLLYKLVFTIYNSLTVFIYPFQRKFINMYTVNLQLNRLPFRTIPNVIKYILIYFVDISSWILFFKRIKNNTNLYIIREKGHSRLHRFWCVFFRNKAIYYSELNIKRRESEKIANFFYKSRIVNKRTKKISGRKYNVIVFYYLNKIVLVNYPYFYWTYFFAYDSYNYNSKASAESQHARLHVFFFFLNEANNYDPKKEKSFIKFDFYTFKGIKKTMLNIDKIKKNRFVLKKKKLKDKILTKIEDQVKLLDKTFIKIYFELNKVIKLNYKFYIQTIIFSNLIKIDARAAVTLLNAPKRLKIVWYNKIHNTTINILKNSLILFIRSAKHFNKGRYSRNRQLYRTGVYWCIWLNIIIVYSLHYYFYRVVYSFGYLWFPVTLMLLAMAGSRLYKYRYYNISQIIVEVKEFNNLLFCFFLKFQKVYARSIKLKFHGLIKMFINYSILLYRFVTLKMFLFLSFFGKIFFL